jgi:hypothetical protein
LALNVELRIGRSTKDLVSLLNSTALPPSGVMSETDQPSAANRCRAFSASQAPSTSVAVEIDSSSHGDATRSWMESLAAPLARWARLAIVASSGRSANV